MKALIFFAIVIASISPFSQTIAQSKQTIKIITLNIIDANGLPIRDVVFMVDDVMVKPKSEKSGVYRININYGTKEIRAFSSTYVQVIKYTGQKEASLIFPIGEKLNQDLEPESQIYKKDMADFGYDDIYSMIVAKIPGARLVNGNQINLRNSKSLGGTPNQPLYIVNGFESASISHISPHEVNSISALVGPETTMYGVKGANGVILINLKNNHAKKIEIIRAVSRRTIMYLFKMVDLRNLFTDRQPILIIKYYEN